MTETKEKEAAAPAAPKEEAAPAYASQYCDKCGAHAKGVAVLDPGPLYLCGHHLREYLPALAAAGAKVAGETTLKGWG